MTRYRNDLELASRHAPVSDVVAGNADKSPAIERVNVDQLNKPRMRRLAPSIAPIEDPLSELIPSQWRWMSVAIALAAMLMALTSGTWPGWLATAEIFAASALCAAGPGGMKKIARKQIGQPWQYALLAAAVTVPMALFGLGAGHWVTVAGTEAGLVASVGGAAIVSLVASVLLNGRLVSVVAALSGLWLGPCLYTGSLWALAMLLLGVVMGMLGITRQDAKRLRDAVGRDEHEQEQSRAAELLVAYEETGQGWFWEANRQGEVTYVTPSIARLVGKSLQEIKGRALTELFANDTQGSGGEGTLLFHLSTRTAFQELSVLAATPDREDRWWSISGRPVTDQYNNFLGFRGSGTDLTEARKTERRVVQMARIDSLTQLANRFQMTEWLETILHAPRDQGNACGILLLDLDRFKRVNDTFGHPAGDALLRDVGNRLRKTVGSSGKAGRLGGDEFQVILPGIFTQEELAHQASRIIEEISQPFMIEGNRVSIGVSIGVALSQGDGLVAEDLIRNADLALYAAKDGGRGQYRFYADDLLSDARERQQLEDDLRDAIAEGGLELHYQPQVRVTTEKIVGFEALLRWKHPRLGPISPAKFVPIAEEAGLISQIGEWVLRTACQDMVHWPDEVSVAVNVSALQFFSSALPAIVTSAVAAAGILPRRLELEITESVFLGDSKATEPMFAALKRVGVRLALDDFGTGYSSLSYLRSAPFDKIKIDQSFVRGASQEGSRNAAIIAAIVGLAEALGMETTAEGVETLDELDLIREMGCSHAQGYVYSKPMNVTDATQQIESGLGIVASGPRSARRARKAALRKVRIVYDGQNYAGTVRNLSHRGVMIEGIRNITQGSALSLELGGGLVVNGICRWSDEDRIGMEFDQPITMDAVSVMAMGQPKSLRGPQKRRVRRNAG